MKILKEEMENLQSGFNPFHKTRDKEYASGEETTTLSPV
jgi:hypothetical protein